ncbi:MAG: class I SAM-dependent methyltransferase [Gemmatimonadota bacterium]|nr:MAG: class I SAM-dependent methyltransferase [Gemmatimonadota bacterium]
MRNRYARPAPRYSSWRLPLTLLAAALPAAALQAQQRNRDDWQRVPDVMAALAIGEGSHVADVGAGSGYFTAHLSRYVGASGRVFAEDISERALAQLRQLVESEGLENVEVVRGEIDDPKLPDRSLDAVLVVNAYHMMTEYRAMLSGMYNALKPGGRIVIIDRVPSDPVAASDRQTARYELSIDLVAQELREAGFQVVDRDELFAETGYGGGQWMVIARR